MMKTTQPNVLKLFKSTADQDIILARLMAINEILNDCESDEVLDIVQNKVLEAIDWYSRYCDINGYEVLRSKPD